LRDAVATSLPSYARPDEVFTSTPARHHELRTRVRRTRLAAQTEISLRPLEVSAKVTCIDGCNRGASVSVEASIEQGDWSDPTIGRIKLSEYIAQWMRERELKARTREEYERHIRLHVLPLLGSRELVDVTVAMIRTVAG
jgi:hypothetical protein